MNREQLWPLKLTDFREKCKPNVVICSCDNNYYEYLLVFIKSYKKYNETELIVRCISMDDEKVKRVSEFQNVTVLIDNTKLSNVKDIITRGIDAKHPRMNSYRTRLCSEIHCYSAHSKFNNINECFYLGYTNVLSMDVDAIFRGSIDNIFKKYDDSLFVIDYTSRMHGTYLPVEYPVFKEGVMLASKSIETKILFRYITNKINKLRLDRSSDYDIDSDHELLAWTYNRLSKKYQFAATKLDNIYKDTIFNDVSLIWSGKGDRKSSNEKYVKLHNQILVENVD